MTQSPARPGGLSPSASGCTTPLLPNGRAATPPPAPCTHMPARLLDTRKRHRLTLERQNLHGSLLYATDIYHTLLNCPWYRFYLVFILFYAGMYCFFATWYFSQPGCITHVQTFLHALWFSTHTSATIGYGHQAPNPQCTFLQLGIMCQVLTSLLFQATLLGLVFARISNSSGRSTTIRFSKVLSMYRGDDGLDHLAFRVANLRQHQVLQPEVRMLLLRRQQAHPFSSNPNSWEYVYSQLTAQHIGGGQLWLGVPSVIEHKVEAGTPLFNMSQAEMMASDIEFIVLLDGIDESTSRAIEARHSYVPADIRWQHHFDPVIQRRPSGRLGIDFGLFDGTHPRSSPPSGCNTPPPGETPNGSAAVPVFLTSGAGVACFGAGGSDGLVHAVPGVGAPHFGAALGHDFNGGNLTGTSPFGAAMHFGSPVAGQPALGIGAAGAYSSPTMPAGGD